MRDPGNEVDGIARLSRSFDYRMIHDRHSAGNPILPNNRYGHGRYLLGRHQWKLDLYSGRLSVDVQSICR